MAQAIAEQSSRLAYVHSSQFTSPSPKNWRGVLLALAPPAMRKNGRVYFTSGGSEATETALKLCRQYWIERGETKRVPRDFAPAELPRQHVGSALGFRQRPRREPFAPLLNEWGHIPPCYCYRCPLGLRIRNAMWIARMI